MVPHQWFFAKQSGFKIAKYRPESPKQAEIFRHFFLYPLLLFLVKTGSFERKNYFRSKTTYFAKKMQNDHSYVFRYGIFSVWDLTVAQEIKFARNFKKVITHHEKTLIRYVNIGAN